LICSLLIVSKADTDTLTFFSIGDWGEVNSDQAKVAGQMSAWAQKTIPQFIISVGDNFYDDGVSGVDDPQWKTTFEGVFDSTPLKPVPWFAVLGNHDYHQSPEAQIEYTHVSKGKWNMDAHYFSRNMTLGSKTVKFVYFDSIWFAPTHSKHTPVTDPEEKYAEQRTWLEEELKSGVNFDWLIAISHYPVFSKGDGDDPDMQSAVQDLFELYNVDLYLSGHDHTLQHLVNRHVHYVISGNGALRGHFKAETSAESVLFTKVEPGFTIHSITSDGMKVQFVSGLTGECLYEYVQSSGLYLRRKVANTFQTKPIHAFGPKKSSTNLMIIAAVSSFVIIVFGAVIWAQMKTRNAWKRRASLEETEVQNLL
jgi:tartrate-resistant acid phosphatase type 5